MSRAVPRCATLAAILLAGLARVSAAAELPAPEVAAAARPGEPIDRLPYRIELHLAVDPSARLDRASLSRIVREWQALVRRFVGPPWAVTVAPKASPLAGGNLQALDGEVLSGFDPGFDKIWLVRISASGDAALAFTGREYDTGTRRLGPVQEQRASVPDDAPRALLRFALELFNPTALITGQEGGRALLLVRGASVAPASELGRVASKGTVFLPLRLVTTRDNAVLIRRIPFSYLQVEQVDGPVARCAIVSALRDPLTQRVSRPNSLAAIGIKPGKSPVRLRFLTRGDQSPAAGYTLTARAVPDGHPQELGMTDRSGRIVLDADFATGLVILRLLAANTEPMVEIPMMPGEGGDERDIPFDPKPLTVGYQVRLEALRDEVIDLVAIRSRLEKRLEARLQGEDYDAIEQGLKEYALLPRRDVFAKRLEDLKNQATKEEAASKTAVLTKNVQARFNDLQALIDRYLSDDAFTSYTEALERKKAERADSAAARPAARKDTPRTPASPPPPGEPAAPAAPASSPAPGFPPPPARPAPPPAGQPAASKGEPPF
ncbi:hypothetical protein OJF2_24090 [Aquisphaera giovannonii]|uniref:Uncharacterized protein n=1 Tax=Aquisphaera giovannonii TaxID=406548 RepID=A0A5B9W0Q9_9BACT|nr:hypothetical protein [Aquisphaera giovannonii]QEH33877.1 hypothetical protein OJF2_24090 [Aquisphaera giovannonii]